MSVACLPGGHGLVVHFAFLSELRDFLDDMIRVDTITETASVAFQSIFLQSMFVQD